MERAFAKVAVNLSTNKSIKAFIYKVPKNKIVSVGSIVVVPFRNSVKAGYVVSLEDKSNIKKVKSIVSVVRELDISKENRMLANWIAKHYLCSQWAAARLFLPPGSNIKIKRENTDNGSNYSVHLREPKQVNYLKILKKLENGTVLQNKLSSVIEKANLIEKSKALEIVECSTSVLEKLIEKGIVGVVKKPLNEIPGADYKERYEKPKNLTIEQKKALSAIRNKLNSSNAATFLLNGVTGSGKT